MNIPLGGRPSATDYGPQSTRTWVLHFERRPSVNVPEEAGRKKVAIALSFT
jgi:hypothetical protein